MTTTPENNRVVHDATAEAAVLGTAMIDRDAIPDLLELLSPGDFYERRNRLVFEALRELDARGGATDIVAVGTELRARGSLEEAGGENNLIDILECSRTLESLPWHIGTIRKYSRLRAAETALRRGLTAVTTGRPDELEDTVGAILTDLQGALRDSAESNETTADVAARILERIEAKDAAPVGLPTGLRSLDDVLQGLRPGELVLIGARPSVGKSALATTILGNVVRAGRSAMLFSLEVDREQVVRNLIAGHADIDAFLLRRGDLEEEEIARVRDFGNEFQTARVEIDDNPAATVERIRARAKSIAGHAGLDLVIVDYLQLVKSPRAETRNLEVAELSRGLKLLARELRIPVVALSQLNRGPESRDDRMPRLSELRDSGSLEQDADVVLLLCRPTAGGAGEHAVVAIAKNRNGPTGVVKLRFRSAMLRFEDP